MEKGRHRHTGAYFTGQSNAIFLLNNGACKVTSVMFSFRKVSVIKRLVVVVGPY